MALLSFIPANTKIDFVRQRYITLTVPILVVLATFLGLFTKGLNYGVDFKGGFLIEIRTQEPADLSALRNTLGALELGEVKLQEYGSPNDVLIRIERQPGGEQEQNAAIQKVRTALGDKVEYRRLDSVGPKVSETLKTNGLLAVGFSLLAMLVYIWFRYEWQFGLAGILALVHDCIAVMGLYVFAGLEFNESAIIAILTTAGYSINDTVVIYDRIRENLRKYKRTKIADLINLSVNETLSRTVLTSSTTIIALLALYLFGGPVIETFTLPLIFGIVFGTYSSIYLSSILLLYLKLPREHEAEA